MEKRLYKHWRGLLAACMIAMCGGLLTGCSDSVDPDDNIPFTPIELEPMETQVTADLSTFAIELFKDTYRYNLDLDNQKEGNLPDDYDPLNPTPSKLLLHRSNTLVSPLSASMVIGMMANAIDPADQNELMSSIGLGGNSITAFNSLSAKLMGALPVADKKADITMLNSAWFSDGTTVAIDYSDVLSESYKASVNQSDINTKAGRQAINAWYSDKSGGKFTGVIEVNDVKRYDVLWLNALSFNGEWKYQFNPNRTKSDYFTSATNIRSKVKMMISNSIKVETSYYPEGFLSVRLPYGNGAFALTAIRAYDDTKHIDDLVGEFDAGVWAEIQNHMVAQELLVGMPKWKFEARNDLLSILSTRIPEKFLKDDSQVYWSGISDKNHIMSLQQKIMIETDEKGSRVEVATYKGSGSGLNASMVKEIFFDRPFIYVISEQSTGAIVAIGTVMDF